MEEKKGNAVPLISVEDLRNAVKLFDHAFLNGGFKGKDTVIQALTIQDKLNRFADALDQMSKAAKQNEENKEGDKK